METEQIELQIQATPTRLSQEKIFSFINGSGIVFISIAISIAQGDNGNVDFFVSQENLFVRLFQKRFNN